MRAFQRCQRLLAPSASSYPLPIYPPNTRVTSAYKCSVATVARRGRASTGHFSTMGQRRLHPHVRSQRATTTDPCSGISRGNGKLCRPVPRPGRRTLRLIALPSSALSTLPHTGHTPTSSAPPPCILAAACIDLSKPLRSHDISHLEQSKLDQPVRNGVACLVEALHAPRVRTEALTL